MFLARIREICFLMAESMRRAFFLFFFWDDEKSLMTLIWFDKVSLKMWNGKRIARWKASRIFQWNIKFYWNIVRWSISRDETQHAACVNMFDSLGDREVINSYHLRAVFDKHCHKLMLHENFMRRLIHVTVSCSSGAIVVELWFSWRTLLKTFSSICLTTKRNFTALCSPARLTEVEQ